MDDETAEPAIPSSIPEAEAVPESGEVSPAEAAVPLAAFVAAAEPLSAGVLRHRWPARVTHWANALLLVGMIASGLQIYGAFPRFGLRGAPPLVPNPFDGYRFPEAMRLGGWLAGGLNWHFALAWPFVLTGLFYLGFLIVSGEWKGLLFRPSDLPKAWAMQLYYLRLKKEHPPQGKHNALQKAAYTLVFLLGVVSTATGFAIYKPVQLSWLTALFGGYERARYWHFWAVWAFVAFTLLHVALVFAVDPASLRAMITGRYRGRFPSHD